MTTRSEKAAVEPPALLYEMMRSFAVLAQTLNLSHAVQQLGSTRQTVRRHISQLEDSMAVKLFDVQDRRYHLTEAGQRALPSAQSMLAQGAVWLNGQYDHVNGMERLTYEDDNGWIFHQQQQPLSRVWEGESDLLKAAARGWAAAGGELENPAMKPVRPYILVFRDSPGGWICVELGEETLYAKWYGWANARSSIGRALDQFPGGEEFARLTNVPFQEVQAGQGIRLDQVLTKMPRDAGGPLHYIGFYRLMLGMRLPDGSPAIVAAVDRADRLRITDVDPTLIEKMPRDATVTFDRSRL
ncbi:LysR family transcriptional regulator [Sulfitobacter aestuarii]|uniref:LysR family transcriptional regulator n=1 Tax=Sulfitobacter aestuarii TaxID=2161676 RepID=A0ABW5U028_9RHOB